MNVSPVRARAFLIASLSIPLLLSGCGNKPEEEVTVVRPVKIFTLEEGGNVPWELPGQIRALEQAELGFEVAGQIESFEVRQGDRVRAGDVLAKLDPRDYEADLDKAAADLDLANKEEARYRELLDKKAISQQEYDNYVRSQRSAQAAFDRAQKAVQDTSLRAPFAGTVSRIVKESKESVPAKEPVLTLQNENLLEISANLPERAWAGTNPDLTLEEINEKLDAEVVLTTQPDRPIPAQMSEAAAAADPATRTYEVRFLFERPKDMTILPGMTANVRGSTPESAMLREGIDFLVPSHAVSSSPEKKAQVWRIDPETMQVSAVPVEMRQMFGEFAGIASSELEPGDLIAASGVHVLESGMEVSQYQRISDSGSDS